MAEAKEKKLTAASADTDKKLKEAKPVGNAGGLRAGAIVLWVLAIACEILAVLIAFGKINLIPKNPMILFIPALILDLVFVIIGSQLWKKANRIKPASKKNPTLFWLWNNMGLIVTIFAFIPLIILLFQNKNLDKKTKTIAIIAAAVALLIGGACAYDYNPVSSEEKEAAMAAIDGTVYWTAFGKVYHMDQDCQALTNTENLTYGTVEEAIAANRVRLCSFCAKKHEVSGVVTDDTNKDTTDNGNQ